MLASARVELGEFQEAEKDFVQALRRLDDPSDRYVVLTNRSILWIRTERWNEALADLRQAIALQPQAYQSYVNLADLHRRRKEWDEAVTALDQAVARSADPALLYTRALVQLKRKDRSSARRDFERTIAGEPQGGKSARLLSALVELGYLKHQAREYPAAQADFETALRLAPDYGPAHRQLAQTLLAQDRLTEAGKALDRCLELGLKQFEVYKTRGLIHNKRKEYPAAIGAYTQALLLNREVETLCLRGWVYLQLRSAPLALADFDSALAQEPASADALSGRAQARVRLGRLEQALTDAEASVQGGSATPRVLFSAACIHARAAGRGSDSGGLRPQLASSQHAERAIDLLTLALREMPAQDRPTFWRQHVLEEASLTPLWSQSKMRQLARSYNGNDRAGYAP